MANQSKLKAWVRYDGTGRVISGGPIFQVNKPKVGNWKQIDANLCCNGGSTTTTTTTSGGGGVTPTAWVVSTGFSQIDTCGNIPYLIVYTSQSTLGLGVAVYLDASLTQPYSSMAGTYIATGGFVYAIFEQGVINSVAVTC